MQATCCLHLTLPVSLPERCPAQATCELKVMQCNRHNRTRFIGSARYWTGPTQRLANTATCNPDCWQSHRAAGPACSVFRCPPVPLKEVREVCSDFDHVSSICRGGAAGDGPSRKRANDPSGEDAPSAKHKRAEEQLPASEEPGRCAA